MSAATKTEEKPKVNTTVKQAAPNNSTEKNEDNLEISEEEHDEEDLVLDGNNIIDEDEVEGEEANEEAGIDSFEDESDVDDDDDEGGEIQYIDEVGEEDEDEIEDEVVNDEDNEGKTDKEKSEDKKKKTTKESEKDSRSKSRGSSSKTSSRDSRHKKRTSSTDKRRRDDSDGEKSERPKRRCHLNTAAIEKKRKIERDERSLFLNNLPKNITEEEIKKLSEDIVDVRIPLEHGKYMVTQYAFIEFKDEATAEKNFKELEGKEINEHKLYVDFCGRKSTVKKKEPIPVHVNKKKLFIPDIPAGITVDDFKKYMSEATQLSTIIRGTKRILFASFDSEEAAEQAFQENENLEINGKKLTVLYAAVRKRIPRMRSSYSGYKPSRSYYSRRGYGRERSFRGRSNSSNRGYGRGRGYRSRGMSPSRGFRGRGYGGRGSYGRGYQQSRSYRGRSFH